MVFHVLGLNGANSKFMQSQHASKFKARESQKFKITQLNNNADIHSNSGFTGFKKGINKEKDCV